MRIRWTLSAVLLGMFAGIQPALAEYPDQPVKVVVPFAAGGFIDTVARVALSGWREASIVPSSSKIAPALGAKSPRSSSQIQSPTATRC